MTHKDESPNGCVYCSKAEWLAIALEAVLRDYEMCSATGDMGKVWKANLKRGRRALGDFRRLNHIPIKTGKQ